MRDPQGKLRAPNKSHFATVPRKHVETIHSEREISSPLKYINITTAEYTRSPPTVHKCSWVSKYISRVLFDASARLEPHLCRHSASGIYSWSLYQMEIVLNFLADSGQFHGSQGRGFMERTWELLNSLLSWLDFPVWVMFSLLFIFIFNFPFESCLPFLVHVMFLVYITCLSYVGFY